MLTDLDLEVAALGEMRTTLMWIACGTDGITGGRYERLDELDEEPSEDADV